MMMSDTFVEPILSPDLVVIKIDIQGELTIIYDNIYYSLYDISVISLFFPFCN